VDAVPSKSDTPFTAKSKGKAFRIGGKAKKAADESPPPSDKTKDATPDLDADEERRSPETNPNMNATPPRIKRTFRIGGKGRNTTNEASQAPVMADRTRAKLSPSVHTPSSPRPKPLKEESPIVEEEHEETPEEKAARKRAELKRKTEEAAKKQAQSKKKRRF
jgi:hypothetical protein